MIFSLSTPTGSILNNGYIIRRFGHCIIPYLFFHYFWQVKDVNKPAKIKTGCGHKAAQPDQI
jgi:hypothetical protein